MFLHVGADVVVSLKRVIAILDLRTVRNAEPTREFLELMRSQREIINVDGGEPKSLVLTDDELYFSPISSLTLMKRASFLSTAHSTRLGGPTT